MKVFAYSRRPFDELPLFRRYVEEFGMDFDVTADAPSVENAELARGSDFVSVLTTRVTPVILDRYAEMGVSMVCARTIGYDHIDIEYAKVGITVTHITYDPAGVAEYTVMMMLMALRRLKEMEIRNARNDFTLSGLLGKELKECTVGIIGAGGIGKCVMKDLSGFGCRVVYCNHSPSEEVDRYAERLSMDELLAQSDVVSLHLEHNDQTHHIIGREAISRMKDGVVFVNTARGPLVDTEALIDALKSGKIGTVAIDVMENEFGYYYNDCTSVSTEGHFMDMILNSFKAFRAAERGEEILMRL